MNHITREIFNNGLVFNATFNTILVISSQSDFIGGGTGSSTQKKNGGVKPVGLIPFASC
jgi:hypothetical protein